jgi:hypothetical protein
MPTWTSPVTFNDGTAHIFTQTRLKLQPSGDIGAVWEETAATTKPKPQVTVRSRELKNGQIQHSEQYRVTAIEEDGVTESEILVSVSLFRTTGQTEANCTSAIKIVGASFAATGFYSNFYNRADS